MTNQLSARHHSPAMHFALHYIEMTVVMVVGMLVLDAAERATLGPLGWNGFIDTPGVDVFVMATNMAVPMAVWMLVRGHSPRTTLAMSAAMYAPFVVLVPMQWTGIVSSMTVMTVGHVGMFTAMFAVMWARRSEFTGHA